MSETPEELEAFAAAHGIPALLDHLGLDELGNEVNELHKELRNTRIAVAALVAKAGGNVMVTRRELAAADPDRLFLDYQHDNDAHYIYLKGFLNNVPVPASPS